MSKDEFLEKHNPNDNYPFWDNSLSKDLDIFIKEHDKAIRADERKKFAESLRKFICKENCGERRCIDKFDECVWVGYIDEFSAKYEKEQKQL